MLRSLEDLFEASVNATDGEIGVVTNFLFDEQTWMIRYIVVKVGNWFSRHDVVIAVTAIDVPDWANKTFRAHLTREQVRNSPDIDSSKPVSRQQETAMREYYGWSARWHHLEFPVALPPAGREFPPGTGDDPHLRSSEHLAGYQVWAREGEIGRLRNFIVDESSWHISYLEVKAGDWLHSRAILIPTHWVLSVSWGKHRINLRPTDHRLMHESPLG
jgi:uncharacterized protein YrrD